MVRGCSGGIVALADLIDAHRGAFEYDWRARFHLSVESIGRSVGWDEAIRLTKILSADPSSALAAARSGWEYPWPWEAILLADLVDVQVASKSKRRPKSWPRPWKKSDRSVRRMGTPMSISEFEALRARARGAESQEVDLGG